MSQRKGLISARRRPLVAIAPIVAVASGGAITEAGVTSTSAQPASPIPQASRFAEIAAEMWGSIQAHFLMPDPDDHGLYREYYPHLPSGRRYAYLWPYSTVLSGVNALAALTGDRHIRDDLQQALDTVNLYFDPDSTPPGYDSYPVDAGGGDKFYDDNEWVGIDMVLAYRTLGDAALLDRARLIFDFAVSGWTDKEMGGGIYWQQGNLESKNTCSNGPAAVLALMLHEETGEQPYLDWATRILDWLDVLYDAETGVYHDNIKVDGTIDPTKWTYNTGTPMHAFALLYRATGDAAFLERARALASDSLAYFAPDRTDDGAPIFPDTPWFNSILHRGYVALYEVDPEPDPTFIRALPDLLLHAWESNRDADGFLPADWGRTGTTGDVRHLLDQAPVMEIAASYARIAR